jgi:hypothetical protein
MCCGRKPAKRNTGKKSGLIKGNIKPDVPQGNLPIVPKTNQIPSQSPPYDVHST